jgi:glycosyltransferase involved in cell wall biosynthesis
MRILQINKFFYPHAGSETVLFNTRALLTARGHEVVDFAMKHPDNVSSPYADYFAPRRDYTNSARPLPARVGDAMSSVYSTKARHQLRRLLEHVRPDVAHMHVVYHQLTLSIVDELARQRVPTVLTLHDYKIGCPAYVLYRDGAPCELCVTGPIENVIVHRCVKGSRAGSLLAAIEARAVRIRGSYRKIDAYIAPSAFAGRVAIASGVDPDTVHVIPNFLSTDELSDPVDSLEDEPRFFFAGRLEEVKGLRDILDSYSTDNHGLGTLVLAGAGGAMEDEVVATATRSRKIEYLGRLSRPEVRAQLRRSRALLLPSRWPENNPMSLLEARAVGIPVICSDMGGLPEMVEHGVDGLMMPSAQPQALSDAIRQLAQDRRLAEEMGRRGYERLLRDNTPDTHYAQLMAVYENARARSAATRPADDAAKTIGHP